MDNLVSQAQLVNHSEYRIIENKWYKALDNHQKVEVHIKINYPEFETRPSSFDVEYMIDGKRHNKHIINDNN